MVVEEKEYLTIVIADDDEDDREFVLKALVQAKIEHKLVEVNDGLQLVNLLENRGKNSITEKEPDLVILDLNMPRVDGFKALQHIKKSVNLKNIPVYILSTSGDKFHMEKAFDLGADGYYRKSAKFDDLVVMVSEVCARHNKN
jgi:CheY-like chemotaxis protein